MLAQAGDSTIASPGRERGQHHRSASSMVSTAAQWKLRLPWRQSAREIPPGPLRKTRRPRRSDDFRGQRPEIDPLALPARQKPDRHVQRFAGPRWSTRAWWPSNRCRSGGPRSRRTIPSRCGRPRKPSSPRRTSSCRQPAAIAAAAAQAALIRLCWPGTATSASRQTRTLATRTRSVRVLRRRSSRPRTSRDHDALRRRTG